jgi:hypothetical protein
MVGSKGNVAVSERREIRGVNPPEYSGGWAGLVEQFKIRVGLHRVPIRVCHCCGRTESAEIGLVEPHHPFRKAEYGGEIGTLRGTNSMCATSVCSYCKYVLDNGMQDAADRQLVCLEVMNGKEGMPALMIVLLKGDSVLTVPEFRTGFYPAEEGESTRKQLNYTLEQLREATHSGRPTLEERRQESPDWRQGI